MRLVDRAVDVDDLLRTLDIEIVKTRDEWADACCPLHPENNPSFSIRLDTGRWICRHGDITGTAIDLVRRVKGLSTDDAETLIGGLPTADPGDERVMAAIQRINGTPRVDHDGDLPEWDARYRVLDPDLMTEYWFERGFDASDMRRFGVKFDMEEERILWPIRDENGNLIGYCARKLPGTIGQKYLYPKGFVRSLYPLDFHSGSSIVLCEGPLDAMWLHKHGIMGLAMLGSALTNEQRKWLFARVSRVTIMTDNDPTGVKTLSKLTKQLSGLDVYFAFVPWNRKDAQECEEVELIDALENSMTVTQAILDGRISFAR